AGQGKGKDEPPLDDAAKAKLRGQALDYLKAELAVYTKLLESSVPQARLTIALALSDWQKDPHLAGIRNPEALAQLPEGERNVCEMLWAEVQALLDRAQKQAP